MEEASSTMITSLPPELTARIVDDLADTPSELHTLALVHSTFLPHCRRHIFHRISLADESPEARSKAPHPCTKLYDLLYRSPSIANYVRELTLRHLPVECNSRGTIPRPNSIAYRLPHLLLILPAISKLHLRLVSWTLLPETFHLSMLHLFQLSTIQHLELYDVIEFPVALCHMATSLTSMSALMTTFAANSIDSRQPELTTIPTDSTTTREGLDRHWSSAPQKISTTLRTLSVDNIFSSPPTGLLGFSHFLQDLRITLYMPIKYHPLTLAGLNSITTLTIELNSSQSEVRDLAFILRTINWEESKLQTLVLVCYPSHSADWFEVEEVLYHVNTCLTLKIRVFGSEVVGDLHDVASRLFPRLQEKMLIEVEDDKRMLVEHDLPFGDPISP